MTFGGFYGHQDSWGLDPEATRFGIWPTFATGTLTITPTGIATGEAMGTPTIAHVAPAGRSFDWAPPPRRPRARRRKIHTTLSCSWRIDAARVEREFTTSWTIRKRVRHEATIDFEIDPVALDFERLLLLGAIDVETYALLLDDHEQACANMRRSPHDVAGKVSAGTSEGAAHV